MQSKASVIDADYPVSSPAASDAYLSTMLSSLAPPSAQPAANGKMPILLTVAAAGLFVAVLLTLQPYSATSHGQAYAKPAHRYIQAALRRDSTKLASLSSSSRAVNWALDAARFHRESLSLWAGATDAWIGAHSGDTTEVFLYPSGESCSTAPIIFRFVGSGSHARVVAVSSSCLDPR